MGKTTTSTGRAIRAVKITIPIIAAFICSVLVVCGLVFLVPEVDVMRAVSVSFLIGAILGLIANELGQWWNA
mgnify:CR=1 FL=1